MTEKQFAKSICLKDGIKLLQRVEDFYTDPIYPAKGINFYLGQNEGISYVKDEKLVQLVVNHLQSRIKELQKEFDEL